jgi:hypothetical protein
MVKTKKFYIFLETLLVATFLFTFGILMGIFIENARVNAVESSFAELETDLLDARLLSDLIRDSECELAIQENIEFADRVFWEARTLTKYEDSNQITDKIKIQHKRYDLLRAIIWMNSIKIKERCNTSYHNVIYLYEYDNPSSIKRAQQKTISNLLMDIKNEEGENVLLLSLAGDIDSPSIKLLTLKYNITELPTILIDENIKITDLKLKEDITNYLF